MIRLTRGDVDCHCRWWSDRRGHRSQRHLCWRRRRRRQRQQLQQQRVQMSHWSTGAYRSQLTRCRCCTAYFGRSCAASEWPAPTACTRPPMLHADTIRSRQRRCQNGTRQSRVTVQWEVGKWEGKEQREREQQAESYVSNKHHNTRPQWYGAVGVIAVVNSRYSTFMLDLMMVTAPLQPKDSSSSDL